MRDFLKHQKDTIDQSLEHYISKLPEIPTFFKEAIKYSLLSSAKRIRPLLLLATAKALGAESLKVMPFACAIEMIHTYSLIHDDLPSMDNDDFRRGKLTSHKVYGEGIAILVGDALLSQVFQLYAEGARNLNLSSGNLANILSDTTKYIGARGMIKGQAIDIQIADNFLSLEGLKDMYLRKTADLMSLSVSLGVYAAKGTKKQLKIMASFAQYLGLAFQIRDDILDFEEDRNNNKKTYPVIIGLENAKTLLTELLISAKNKLKNLDKDTRELNYICDYLFETKSEIQL